MRFEIFKGHNLVWISCNTIKIATFASIAGAALVSLNQPFAANAIWSISNPYLAVHNHYIGQKEQSNLFTVFTILAWFGVAGVLIHG